ncbi:MAG: hypothetical protein KTR25_04230 [Myxococcales bacterium]|nr:hypothetical protein [Myxococcales bacterium]
MRINPKNTKALELLLDSGEKTSITTDKPMMESEPSPDGQYVAALVLNSTPTAGSLPKSTLHVWSKEGPPITRISGAQRFEFSPDSKYLAVILGRPYEGALGFITERVEIVSLPSCKSVTAQGLESARDIAWIKRRPPFGLQLIAEVSDENGRSKIVRYNPVNGRIRNTHLKGLHCSPDGEFYVLTAREAEQAGMCRGRRAVTEGCVQAFTWENRRVRLPTTLKIRGRIRWARRSGHELLVNRRRLRRQQMMSRSSDSSDTVLLDVGTGAARVVQDAPVDWSWRTRRGDVILKNSGRPRPRALQKLRKRILYRKLQQNY